MSRSEASRQGVAIAPIPFGDDDTNRLRLGLLRVARSIRSNSVSDITPSQLAVLTTLKRHGPSTIGQIAEHEHVRAPSASKIVATLEERGLVERTTDPTDRRSASIALSDGGRREVAAVRAAGTSWLTDRLATLSPDDQEALRAAIGPLERLLRDGE